RDGAALHHDRLRRRTARAGAGRGASAGPQAGGADRLLHGRRPRAGGGTAAPDLVRGLALLATPWDFHTGNDGAALARLLPVLEPMMTATGTLPIDALQTLFALLDPFGVVH